MGHDLSPILVTGASGYLGSHVVARLNARRLSNVPTSLGGRVGDRCDLTDVVAVRALLDRTQPSIVIHCAAMVPKSGAAYRDSTAADTSLAMVNALADTAGCPVILASSMTVYDNAAAFPVDEEDAVEPLAAGYARGKWMAEQRLFRRHRPGDVALRLPGLFGLPRRSGVLYNAAKAFLTFGRFELAAPPRLWAAMAVEDAAEYLVRAATMPSESPAQAVNVGYEGEFNIASAVAEVAACCGTEWQAPAVDVKMFSMRLQRLESRYGRPAVTFGQRVQEFVHAVRRDLASASAARVSAR